MEQAILEIDIVPFHVPKFPLSNSGEHQELEHRTNVGTCGGEDLADLLGGEESRDLLRDLHTADFRHFC
jgi:hypothetical protein